MATSLFILYVHDQKLATEFYRAVLRIEPTLDVPGMTEFPLPDGAMLGLMPSASIARLLEHKISFSANESRMSEGTRTPRAELYLHVQGPAEYHARAVAQGAVSLSPLTDRDWGDRVAYSMDPDGYILAFAERISE